MTRTSLPRVFALAPIGNEGIAIAAAACRAKALGWVDLSSERCPSTAECFARIGKLTADPFGIRVHANAILSGPLLEPALHSPAAVWVPAWSLDPESLPELAARIASTNRIAIAEVTTRAGARMPMPLASTVWFFPAMKPAGGAAPNLRSFSCRECLPKATCPCGCEAESARASRPVASPRAPPGSSWTVPCYCRGNHRLPPSCATASADGMAVKPLWSLRARDRPCGSVLLRVRNPWCH